MDWKVAQLDFRAYRMLMTAVIAALPGTTLSCIHVPKQFKDLMVVNERLGLSKVEIT